MGIFGRVRAVAPCAIIRIMGSGTRAKVVLFVALIGAGCATQRVPLQVSVFPPVQLVPASTEVDGLRLDLPYGVNGVVRGVDVGVVGSVTQQLAGVQLHLGIGSAAEVDGVQLGLNPIISLNCAERLRGLQLAGFVTPFWAPLGFNVADDMEGVQVATVANSAGSHKDQNTTRGAQLSFLFNHAESDASLLQMTVFGANVCEGSYAGVQTTLYIGCNYVNGNTSGAQLIMIGANVTRKEFRGIQLGAVNWASQVKGIQLGILNYCHNLCGVQIGIANVCMEQALPFLPIINARF